MVCPKPHAPTIFAVTSRVNVEAKLRIPETADDSIVEHPFLIVSTMALPQVHICTIHVFPFFNVQTEIGIFCATNYTIGIVPSLIDLPMSAPRMDRDLEMPMTRPASTP